MWLSLGGTVLGWREIMGVERQRFATQTGQPSLPRVYWQGGEIQVLGLTYQPVKCLSQVGAYPYLDLVFHA